MTRNRKQERRIRNDYSHIAFTCLDSEFIELKTKLLNCGSSEWAKNESEGKSFYFTNPDGHKLEIHVGDLNSRLKEMHNNPWAEFKFCESIITNSVPDAGRQATLSGNN